MQTMRVLNADGQMLGRSHVEYSRPNTRDFDQKLRMIVSTTNQPRIVSVTCDLADLLGYTVEQLLGRSLTILHGPESDAPAVCAAIKAATYMQNTELTATFYDRSGTVHRYLTSLSPELDGDAHSIGCQIFLHPKPDQADAHRSEGATAALHGSSSFSSSSRRSQHNRYVGLILQHEALSPAPSPALRREEDVLLCRLLAAA
jgi:hypothetical protein